MATTFNLQLILNSGLYLKFLHIVNLRILHSILTQKSRKVKINKRESCGKGAGKKNSMSSDPRHPQLLISS